MGDPTFSGIAWDKISEYYTRIIMSSWPILVGSILIPILALFIFLWKAPWGIAGGYLNIGAWFYYLIGVIEKEPTTPWFHPIVLSTFGLFIGALASALMSREFKFQKASGLENLKGLIGGALMGAGAALSGGCNVGGFFTAIAMFSFGGFAMWFGLIAGAFVGLRILLWELNTFPHKQMDASPIAPAQRTKRMRFQAMPYVGGFLIIFMVLQLYIASRFDKTSYAGLCFIGMLLGITMHRTRFCFAAAFRDPFMTGDYRMIKAVIIALLIYCSGTAVIKWNYIQPYAMGVHHIWSGSIIGGFIFGVGMLLAGGCASSTVWRLAEGQTKYLVTAISFCLVNPVVSLLLKKYQPFNIFGKGIFLPEAISWGGALPLVLIFLMVWGFIAVWNERTEKLVL